MKGQVEAVGKPKVIVGPRITIGIQKQSQFPIEQKSQAALHPQKQNIIQLTSQTSSTSQEFLCRNKKRARELLAPITKVSVLVQDS